MCVCVCVSLQSTGQLGVVEPGESCAIRGRHSQTVQGVQHASQGEVCVYKKKITNAPKVDNCLPLPLCSVAERMGSREGMSCAEFLYPCFQAFDFLHLHQHHNCWMQVSGLFLTPYTCTSGGLLLPRALQLKVIYIHLRASKEVF